MPNDAASVFGRIWAQRLWSQTIASGVGSDPAQAGPYLELLRRSLQEWNVRSVLDLGCGDWGLASQIDWSGIDYLGVDVVVDLIEQLRDQHETDRVRFVARDAASDHAALLDGRSGRPFDLLLCKDVLQHWPNKAVGAFLGALPRLAKRALLVNDVVHDERRRWGIRRRAHERKVNTDIELGDWRPVRVELPPFSLQSTRVADFEFRDGRRRWIKEVRLWSSESAHAPAC